MSSPDLCPQCGHPLGSGLARGLCLRCLVDFGLAPQDIGGSAAAPASVEPARSILAGDGVGDQIGPYKLRQRLGEGGCGVVYMADQQTPVHRRVALKVIKPGMDTRAVVARFEAERQALAMMDHPHIAQVLDVGETITGRPYFVMELVRGAPITDYCDQNQLPARERLELFIKVCEAIQHAHQKGIIHRDIKPPNVLVTFADGAPTPKVIDFGIAKAMEGRLTDKTLFTAMEQFMGTPAYMSPEQAEMTGLDIDSRTDVYSLGVLLYELLTGVTPFDGKELAASGLDAMRKTIREKEPVRPSTRLTQLQAASGRSSLAPRPSSLASDLDWIVMKALEKDRTRRYSTASGLAADVRRHLNHELVEARSPSALYRLQKMAKRHRAAFASAVAIVAALVGALAFSTYRLGRERAALRESERSLARERVALNKSEQVLNLTKEMLRGVGPGTALGQDTALLRQILDATASRISRDLRGQPEVEVELRNLLGDTYLQLGELTNSAAMYERALDLARALPSRDSRVEAATLKGLASTYVWEGRYPQAIALLHEARQLAREMAPPDLLLLGETTYWLAIATTTLRQDLAAAEQLHRDAVALLRAAAGDHRLEVANALSELAFNLWLQGRANEAEENYRQALALQRESQGDEHPYIATTMQALGLALEAQNRLPEAEHYFREDLAMTRKFFGQNHHSTAKSLQTYVWNLAGQGKIEQAEPLAREYRALKQALGSEGRDSADAQALLGSCWVAQRKYREAEPILSQGYEGLKRPLGELDPADRARLRITLKSLIQLHRALGHSARATEYQSELSALNRGSPAGSFRDEG